MPRSQRKPAARARSMFGRMPTAMTTRSAAARGRRRAHAGDPRLARRMCASLRPASRTSRPRCSNRVRRSLAAGLVELPLHQVSSRCTTVTFMPARAAHGPPPDPSRPPPITTARRCVRAAVSMVSTSCRSRKVMTPASKSSRDREHDRLRAGRDQQPVVGGLRCRFESYAAPGAIDVLDADRRLQRDALFGRTSRAGGS